MQFRSQFGLSFSIQIIVFSLFFQVIEQPRLINKNVMIAVSSKNISVTHDDESDPMKMGGLIMRFPMKYVSVIKWVRPSFFPSIHSQQMAPDHFAFIAKRLDGSNRRCCVFNAMKIETVSFSSFLPVNSLVLGTSDHGSLTTSYPDL